MTVGNVLTADVATRWEPRRWSGFLVAVEEKSTIVRGASHQSSFTIFVGGNGS